MYKNKVLIPIYTLSNVDIESALFAFFIYKEIMICKTIYYGYFINGQLKYYLKNDWITMFIFDIRKNIELYKIENYENSGFEIINSENDE
jgi:hypothetical protein